MQSGSGLGLGTKEGREPFLRCSRVQASELYGPLTVIRLMLTTLTDCEHLHIVITVIGSIPICLYGKANHH